MNEGQRSDQIRILPIAPPPMLAETLGYFGQARKVAFYWGSGDEAYYHDGSLNTQAEWDAYRLFVRHPVIALLVQGYNLGSSEEEATHWLLLDREALQLAIAPARVAEQVLMAQWGATSAPRYVVQSQEEWDRLVAKAAARIERINQERIAHMFEHRQRVQDLASWLEMIWQALRLSGQKPAANKPTLADIRELATQLEFDFCGGGPHDGTFDLDKRGDRSTGGTWSNTQTGIDDAYGYLVRYRHTLEQPDQTRDH